MPPMLLLQAAHKAITQQRLFSQLPVQAAPGCGVQELLGVRDAWTLTRWTNLHQCAHSLAWSNADKMACLPQTCPHVHCIACFAVMLARYSTCMSDVLASCNFAEAANVCSSHPVTAQECFCVCTHFQGWHFSQCFVYHMPELLLLLC